jgi:hypothetical protein
MRLRTALPFPTILFLVSAVLSFASSPVAAQTKRALLIGIDTYEPKGKAVAKPSGMAQLKNAGETSRWDLPTWINLDGSLNDVESVHQLLASPKFGFAENNIHIVTQEKATREGILQAMKKYLLDEPSRGDTIVFYYAGHGSQRYNSLTDKPFHLDETIVPSDASGGAFDIRDKEIARLFNQIVDRLLAEFLLARRASRDFWPTILATRPTRPIKIRTANPPPDRKTAQGEHWCYRPPSMIKWRRNGQATMERRTALLPWRCLTRCKRSRRILQRKMFTSG